MNGIERIHINSNWKDWRTDISSNFIPTVNEIYRGIFKNIGMPIAEGYKSLECTKEEAVSRYDWKEGIDCLLYFSNKTKATLQEKILTYHESTVTFEDVKGNGEPGAWFYCTANYYFVGYARQYLIDKSLSLQDWILIDLASLHRYDGLGKLKWGYNKNNRDGRRAAFRFIHFDNIPYQAIVSRCQTTVIEKINNKHIAQFAYNEPPF